MLLLVAASIAMLPLVHAIVAAASSPGPAIFAAGLLSMALAWAGGCAIEQRRHGSVLAIAAVGVAQALVPLVPQARDLVGSAALMWPVVAAALSAVALALAVKMGPAPRARA